MNQSPNLNDNFAKKVATTIWATTITLLTTLAIIKACTPQQ
jgi:hypothetical protein